MGGKKTNFDVFSRFNYKTAFLVMAEVILMPRLSDTMTEGVIAAWHKKVGRYRRSGLRGFVGEVLGLRVWEVGLSILR